MFAVGGDRCPINLYKQYESHRPATMKGKDSPFYLGIKIHRSTYDPLSAYGRYTPMGQTWNDAPQRIPLPGFTGTLVLSIYLLVSYKRKCVPVPNCEGCI